jgi:hypothetical protein
MSSTSRKSIAAALIGLGLSWGCASEAPRRAGGGGGGGVDADPASPRPSTSQTPEKPGTNPAKTDGSAGGTSTDPPPASKTDAATTAGGGAPATSTTDARPADGSVTGKDAAAPTPTAYTTYSTWADLVAAAGAKFPPMVRLSDPGTAAKPVYTGFWFFGCLQFDATDRYALAMKVYFQGRPVTPSDVGDIGYYDLKDGNKWTKIGESTAWNWQQGGRLQWRPSSNEIVWNNRASDGKSYVTSAYDFDKKTTRTLPRPIYSISPDGKYGLTQDYERMTHPGTNYPGIADAFAGQVAPAGTGIWKMDMDSGAAELIVSLQTMSKLNPAPPLSSPLYIFRSGWNTTGTRFVAFLKNQAGSYTAAWSVAPDGSNIRLFYNNPSHHTWRDDQTILEGNGAYLYKDDGSGKSTGTVVNLPTNADPSYVPGTNNEWIVGDTYALENKNQHIYLIHVPTKKFVALAKLKSTAVDEGVNRIDNHVRPSRSGRTISFDASPDGQGRQLYIMDIGFILDNPPH